MGREVRRVPENWEHPKDEYGDYIPLEDMPHWSEEEKTHLQMYEDISDGTPISPVMKTPEELARWLVDNNASAFGGMTASYDQWLATIKRGWAPSATYSPRTGLVSGVEGWEDKQ